MRLMSFSMTTRQIRAGTKTVTRRLGWSGLQAGEQVCAIEKGQGLKKGQKVKRIRVIQCVSNRREPLNKIDQADCRREGFPKLTPAQFVEMFCAANGCRRNQKISRIQFKYVG